MLKPPTLNKQIKKPKPLRFKPVNTITTTPEIVIKLTNLFELLKKKRSNTSPFFEILNFSCFLNLMLLIRFKKQQISKILEINSSLFKFN